MPSNDPEPRDPSPDEAAALRAFWSVYAPNRERVAQMLQSHVMKLPDVAAALQAVRPEEREEVEKTSQALQERALLNGEWPPLRAHLREQGRKYAELGVSFATWFELVTLYRKQMRQVLAEVDARDRPLAALAHEGLNRFMDETLREIGEAYLETKETLIRRQQEAIRELSTPVLQIRERLLIIPVVGMVDTLRARQLSEALLRAIRERRARVVVMDITGVPIVDSRVANHLVQACEAARLMGAHVIITGISSHIAQALVTIGAELRGVPTLGDLQTGLEEAERLLTQAPAQLGALAAAPVAAGEGK